MRLAYLLNNELGTLSVLLGDLLLLDSGGELLSEPTGRQNIRSVDCPAGLEISSATQKHSRHVGLQIESATPQISL